MAPWGALIRTALALLVLFGPAAARAAQVVVVESTGSRLYGHAVEGFRKVMLGIMSQDADRKRFRQPGGNGRS